MTSTTPEHFLQACETATTALRSLFAPTPLQQNLHLSERFGARVYLKREDLTPVRSYKLRGAYNFFRKALAEAAQDPTPDSAAPSFVCASAGNHAQGFAFACQHFGVKGVVYMPVTTPQQKIDKTRVFGGDKVEIRLFGDFFDQCNQAALDHAADSGARMVPPFDHPDIIEGQASVALEFLDQCPENIDVLILPVGGGGLAAGICQIMAARSPDTQIVFAEPKGAPSFKSSLQQQARIKLDQVDNFVDGAAVAQIGEQNFAILKDRHPDDVLLIPEDRLCETIIEMLNVEGVVLEPAGALQIDALRSLTPDQIQDKTVVCVTSGGNFDFERLPEVKERALKAAGLKKYYILRLPQRPGALKDFLQLLGPDDDIARFEYLKKSARNFGSILLGVETKAAQNFETLNKNMTDAGFAYRDITHDDDVAGLLI
ncbi:threonine ammonia-lyase IlvA [Rhodovibrionaceae bacterium A322]